MTKTSILVTGAGGLVGSCVTSLLYNSGYEVTGIYRKRNMERTPWSSFCIDLASENLDYFFSNKNFFSIVHCAAIMPASFSIESNDCEVNQKIDDNVINFIDRRKMNIVFISSTSLYGFSSSMKSEDDSITVKEPYSKIKYKTEQRIGALDKLSAVSLRINAPYSFRQKNRTVLKIFIENAIADKDIIYNGTGSRKQDYTHVSDIANAVKLSLEAEEPGVYNIASGSPVSMKTLAELVVSQVPGCKSNIIQSGIQDPQETYAAAFNINKAKSRLGWQPKITLEEGIKEWVANIT